MTTTSINEQVSMECSSATLLSPLARLDSGHSRVVLCCQESCDLSIGNDADFGPLRDTIAHVPLQQRAAEAEGPWHLWQRQQPFGRNDGERNLVGGSSNTIHTQLIHDTGEELLQDRKGGSKQSMYVIRLRNAFAVVRRRREDVAVNNGDGVKGIVQDTSSKEPGETATDDQGMATSVPLCSRDGFIVVIHCCFPIFL